MKEFIKLAWIFFKGLGMGILIDVPYLIHLLLFKGAVRYGIYWWLTVLFNFFVVSYLVTKHHLPRGLALVGVLFGPVGIGILYAIIEKSKSKSKETL